MTNTSSTTAPGSALMVLGCPEVPVQQALALHLSFQLRSHGFAVHATSNPAVLNLLKVSDPEKRYLPEMSILEKCIEEIVEKAVHNPMKLKKMINEVFGWAA